MRINIKDILEEKQSTKINIRETLEEGEAIHVSDALKLEEAEEPKPEIQPDPEPVIEVMAAPEPAPEPEEIQSAAEPEPESEPEPEAEDVPESAPAPEELQPAAEPEPEQEPELEVEDASESAPEPEEIQLTAEPEPEHEVEDASESAPEPEEIQPAAEPEPNRSHISRYGAIYGNILLMALIVAFAVVYTTMTPRTIHATINGEETDITTEKYTVIKALDDAGLEYCDEDFLSVVPEAYVSDGMELELIHAKDFTVTADGETKAYKSLEETVGGALRDKGIKVGDIDIVEPDMESKLEDDSEIVVKRVVIKEETVTEATDFDTVTESDSSMAEGKTKVKKEGVKGEDQVTYRITYTDGKETKRKELDRKTIKEPVAEVVAKGTAVTFNGKIYKKKLQVKAYSYTGGGRTAMGTKARVGEIAVDPKVIPLGTTVYIPGIGERRAEDTGGNIKGKTIDIYMSSKSACRKWGRRNITIYLK